MKNILAVILISMASFANKSEQRNRHFLIGWTGPSGNLIQAGGYDTTSNKFPNAGELRLFFCKRYGLNGCYITAITEFKTEADASEFYR